MDHLSGAAHDERGLEVSPCGFLQDQLVERQIRHSSSQLFILLLEPLQFLQLIYAHSTILLAPAVIGLFNNSNLSDPIQTDRHGHPPIGVSSCPVGGAGSMLALSNGSLLGCYGLDDLKDGITGRAGLLIL